MRYVIGRWTPEGQLLVNCPECTKVQWAERGPGVYRCGEDTCNARLSVAARPHQKIRPEAQTHGF